MSDWRTFENNRIDAHAAAAHQEIWRMSQKALDEINEKKCFVARSIGQNRRYSNNHGGSKK